ncbi:MAG: hypothetical protein KME01_16440 [Chroococcus sp. CMT-3BRIN-NPC107]|nr:hypothetical protein [Chroococcus sp. CMT-3BRIN-NPC107]
MNAWNLPWEGSCRCGHRIKVSVPPLLTMACHCTGCKRLTASAFSSEHCNSKRRNIAKECYVFPGQTAVRLFRY